MPQFIYLGANDTNNPLPSRLFFGDEDRAISTAVLRRTEPQRWVGTGSNSMWHQDRIRRQENVDKNIKIV